MHKYNVNNQYRRRHLFIIGFFVYQLFAVGIFHGIVSPIFDKFILVISVLSLLTISHALYREEDEVALQRRWYFVLGLGVSTILNLYRAQRFGLLIHGSSYYLEHAPQLKLSRRFRNIIFTRNKDLSETALAKSLLPPTETFFRADQLVEKDRIDTKNRDPTEFLNHIGNYFIKHSVPDDDDVNDNKEEEEEDPNNDNDSSNNNNNGDLLGPSALHANSIITPFVNLQNHIALGGAAKGGATSNIVLVVFNGILAEFIENGPFQAIFNRDSIFNKEWKNALAALKSNKKKSKLTSDNIWSLDKLNNEKRAMSDIFDVASVDDDKSKQPEFRIIRFRPPFGSLESIGTLSTTSTGWLRRMNKIHTILTEEIKLNPKYVFVGYSRGALVSLDVLARANRRPDAHPWIRNVRGMTSVGGPLFGAEGPDFTTTPGHVFYHLLQPIREFAQSLDFEHEGDMGSLGHMKEILQNSWEFFKLGWDLTKVNQTGKSQAATEAESLFKKECGEAGVPAPSLAIITDGLTKLLFQNFDMMSPVGKYYENIKRVKIFVAGLLEGVKDLSTKSRMDWWTNKNNQLPKYIELYSIPATMPGAGVEIESLDQSALFNSASTSTDWWANRMFYYATYGDTGKMCQDGQVSCDRAVFWPKVLERCGWDMENRVTGVLAVIGSHHWGLALPFALDGVPSNVPRAAILDAIGAMYVEKEQLKRGMQWWNKRDEL